MTAIIRSLQRMSAVAGAALVALAIGTGCASDAGDGTVVGTQLERLGSVACGGSYRNQSTSSSVAASYACYPDLSFPGTEWIQRFTMTESGDAVVSVTNYSHYPFIAILRDDGSGVDPSACVAAGYYSVRFPAEAGQNFYVVVDTWGSVPSMTFDAQVECSSPSTEVSCGDGFDNDADYLIDCADSDCDADDACDVSHCTPDGALACGDQLIAGSTSGFGSTNVVESYTCDSDRVPDSPEHAHTFRPTTSGWVNFTLSNFGQYPMLYVIEDDGSGCNPNRCVAHNYYSVKFYATAGKTYYLVVDGRGGTTFDYHVSLVCDPPATETTCDNGIDDDGNGLIDCADPECDAGPACAAGLCQAAYTIDCATTLIAGDTAASGSTKQIANYSCSPSTDTTGREFTYQLGPITRTGPIVVTASDYSTYPLIAVMEDFGSGCNPGACIAEQYYSVRFTARRGKTYYVSVEGHPSAPSMTYDLSVVCNPPVSEAGLCDDNIDNDGDAGIDCDDADCTSACAQSCTVAGALSSSTTQLFGDTAAAGSTNVIDSYGCYPDIAMPGNEVVYSYTATTTGSVLFTLSNFSDYAALAVMEDQGTGCDTNTCVAYQFYSVVANVTAGKTYYVAVDGLNAGSLTYELSVIPNPPYNESGLCGDGIDNDADFEIDCDDPDCSCAP